jgi:misacylated tRNA(Ala) deacylase
VTTLIYHADSYAREVDAVITRVEGTRVALDQTVFYAQSGGQPADHGLLSWTDGEAHVRDVRRADDEIWHDLDGPLPAEGSVVHGAVDWERRYALMRAHTALHILAG